MRADLDLRGQGPVDGTLPGDLEELRSLAVRQRPAELEIDLDTIEHALTGLAVGAVRGMDLSVPEADCHGLERPLPAPCVEPDRHRGARAQSAEQEVVRRSEERRVGKEGKV